jgi:hypothetical protein
LTARTALLRAFGFAARLADLVDFGFALARDLARDFGPDFDFTFRPAGAARRFIFFGLLDLDPLLARLPAMNCSLRERALPQLQ